RLVPPSGLDDIHEIILAPDAGRLRCILGSSTHGDPEALRRAAHLLGDHFLDQFVSPAETAFIQATDRPFQGHLDDDVRVAGGLRHAAEHAGALVDAEPGRTLDEYKPGLLDVPKARHFLALHDPQAQVP